MSTLQKTSSRISPLPNRLHVPMSVICTLQLQCVLQKLDIERSERVAALTDILRSAKSHRREIRTYCRNYPVIQWNIVFGDCITFDNGIMCVNYVQIGCGSRDIEKWRRLHGRSFTVLNDTVAILSGITTATALLAAAAVFASDVLYDKV